MKQNADEITDDSLYDFIQTVGLDEAVVDTIQDMGLTASVMYMAMDDDSQLLEIGIEQAYLRLKFKVLFKRFLLGETLRIASEYPVQRVKEFFQEIRNTKAVSQVCLSIVCNDLHYASFRFWKIMDLMVKCYGLLMMLCLMS